MPKVTVITTTYNREELVPRAIESVLSQSFTDFQYLIVNNGCTDGTQAILERYAKQDSRIRLFRLQQNFILFPDTKEVLEHNACMNKALFASGIPYFTGIDDDDFIKPDMLETLVGLIEEYDADIATVGSKWLYPDGTEKNKYVFDGTFVYDRIQAMMELLKREKINNAAGGKLYKSKICDVQLSDSGQRATRDIYREYRRFNNAQKIVVTGQPKYYFYRHDTNMSGLNTADQITPKKMKQHLEANHERTLWLAVEMPEIATFAHYCEISFMISLYQRIHTLQVVECYAIADEMLRYLQMNRAALQEYAWYTTQEQEFLHKNQLL